MPTTYYLSNNTVTSPPGDDTWGDSDGNWAFLTSAGSATGQSIAVPNLNYFRALWVIVPGASTIVAGTNLTINFDITTASSDISFYTMNGARFSSANAFGSWVVEPDASGPGSSGNFPNSIFTASGNYSYSLTVLQDVTFNSSDKFALQAMFYSSRTHAGPSSIVMSVNGSASYLTLTPPVPTGSTIKVWNGSEWVAKPLKRWNGTEWVDATLKRYNGATWDTI